MSLSDPTLAFPLKACENKTSFSLPPTLVILSFSYYCSQSPFQYSSWISLFAGFNFITAYWGCKCISRKCRSDPAMAMNYDKWLKSSLELSHSISQTAWFHLLLFYRRFAFQGCKHWIRLARSPLPSKRRDHKLHFNNERNKKQQELCLGPACPQLESVCF